MSDINVNKFGSYIQSIQTPAPYQGYFLNDYVYLYFDLEVTNPEVDIQSIKTVYSNNYWLNSSDNRITYIPSENSNIVNIKIPYCSIYYGGGYGENPTINDDIVSLQYTFNRNLVPSYQLSYRDPIYESGFYPEDYKKVQMSEIPCDRKSLTFLDNAVVQVYIEYKLKNSNTTYYLNQDNIPFKNFTIELKDTVEG